MTATNRSLWRSQVIVKKLGIDEDSHLARDLFAVSEPVQYVIDAGRRLSDDRDLIVDAKLRRFAEIKSKGKSMLAEHRDKVDTYAAAMETAKEKARERFKPIAEPTPRELAQESYILGQLNTKTKTECVALLNEAIAKGDDFFVKTVAGTMGTVFPRVDSRSFDQMIDGAVASSEHAEAIARAERDCENLRYIVESAERDIDDVSLEGFDAS